MLLACLLLVTGLASAGEVWVDVDTDKRTLAVLDGSEIVLAFANIAVGSVRP